MNKANNKGDVEYWLRGPIEGIPQLLQPAAHALLQSSKELGDYLNGFPEELLWEKLEGRASVGFHIQHMTGVVDRMMTYAQGKNLTEDQFEFLGSEGVPHGNLTIKKLHANFTHQVDRALTYFKEIPVGTLKEARTVGRKKLPSTVLGLLFHAAEHSQRHIGQLLVTASILNARHKKSL